jgi:hypothetical protein
LSTTDISFLSPLLGSRFRSRPAKSSTPTEATTSRSTGTRSRSTKATLPFVPIPVPSLPPSASLFLSSKRILILQIADLHTAFRSLPLSSPCDWQTYADDKTDSGKVIHRSFCGKCGSALYSHPDMIPDAVFIKVRISSPLFNPSAVQPGRALRASFLLPFALLGRRPRGRFGLQASSRDLRRVWHSGCGYVCPFHSSFSPALLSC